tara:strand:- start:180 stop:539 length:360 start_codon:yes stop_codon:yes gene_type:complete
MEELKSGITKGIGSWVAIGACGMLSGYAILIVSTFESGILMKAARATESQVIQYTGMLQDELEDLREARKIRSGQVDSANKDLAKTIEALRLETKGDIIRLEQKLEEVQRILIDEIRKN